MITQADGNEKMIHYIEAHHAGRITGMELEGFLDAIKGMIERFERDLIDLAVEYDMVRSTSDFEGRSLPVQRAIIRQIRKVANA